MNEVVKPCIFQILSKDTQNVIEKYSKRYRICSKYYREVLKMSSRNTPNFNEKIFTLSWKKILKMSSKNIQNVIEKCSKYYRKMLEILSKNI